MVYLITYLPNSVKGGIRSKCKEGKSRGIKRNVISREQRIGNWGMFIVLEDDVVTQMSLSSCWHTEIYGCFLELLKESGTYSLTRLHGRRRRGSHC